MVDETDCSKSPVKMEKEEFTSQTTAESQTNGQCALDPGQVSGQAGDTTYLSMAGSVDPIRAGPEPSVERQKTTDNEESSAATSVLDELEAAMNSHTMNDNIEPKSRQGEDEADARPLTNGISSGNPSITDAHSLAPTETDARPFGDGPSKSPMPVSVVTTEKTSNWYNLDGPKRVIIFNQKEFSAHFDLRPRRGTEADVRAIRKTFESLSWAVEVKHNATYEEIRTRIRDIQDSKNSEELSALAIFILSHGEDNGTIFAQDCMYRIDADIVNQLTGDKCPSLAGKPKLIFVQACQGKETDPGTKVTSRSRHTSRDSSSTYKIPNYADMLMFQASFWNHYSFRSCETGSWFIQALCQKIDGSARGDSIFDILLETSRAVALDKESNMPDSPRLHQKKQTPLLNSTLLRHLYLKGRAAPSAAVSTRVAVTSSSSVHSSRTTLQAADAKAEPRKKDCRLM